ncbi:hypothetical protein ICE98_01186 [Lactococcus lactis]|nr:hypothetical protein [Lactococcus lactis]
MITSPDGHILVFTLKKPQCVQSLRINYLSTKLGWISCAYKCQQLMTNLVKVLEAFKTKDPNGNGKADEIPYGTGNFDPTMSYTLPFGVLRGADNSNEMMMLNGKPAYIRSTDNFKKGIEAMHDAYTKGLIDPELYTLDPTQAQAKLMADTETVGCVSWLDS